MKQLLWGIGLFFLGFTGISAANPVRGDHVTVRLAADVAQAQPDTPFWIGLQLAHDQNWYSYWRNPGDSGLATQIEWSTPEGVTIGPIQWPTPKAKPYEGLTNYGFGDEVWLLQEVHLPKDWPTNQPLQLKAVARWLVCYDICIPGEATLNLDIPVGDQIEFDDSHHQTFRTVRDAWPRSVAWAASHQPDGDALLIDIAAPTGQFATAAELQFFPFENNVLDHAAALSVATDGSLLRLRQLRSRYFQNNPDQIEGVLKVVQPAGDIQSFQIRTVSTPIPGPFADLPQRQAMPTSEGEAELSLGLLLGFAFLGGMILNVMPCVFPILSLKALTLAEATHRRTAIGQSLAYTAGVLLCFVTLAGVLLALRASGQQLGWGFQLQSPGFIAALTFLLFIMGLSLSGVVHFGTRLGGVGDQLTRSDGLRGAFFTGILAVIVASPCTAPFMGTALGVALVRPPSDALLIFAALGLGMAFPLALIGVLPGVHRLLPRPGPWMLTFKQVLAFPLYLTAVWLLWVFGQQRGVDDMAVLLVGLVTVALGLWLWEQRLNAPRWYSGLSFALIVAAFAIGLSPLLTAPQPATSELRQGNGTSAHLAWEPYSPQRLAALRAEGRPVFVNLTAAWCITCLVNERTALSSESVQAAFAERGVVALKGDWTNGDILITELLNELGRSGVPVYALYLPNQAPQLLPQLLTVNTVINALETL